MSSNVIDGAIYKTAESLQESGTDIKKVVGLENLKKKLQFIEKLIQSPDPGYNLPDVKGMVFAGYPGCGKTWFSEVLARYLGFNIIYVPASAFQSPVKGSGKSRVKKVFDFARKNTPCVIFIDEIDAIGIDREIEADSSGVLQQILTELDGKESNQGLLVICATNVLQKLDPALVRSGRFDEKFIFNLPNLEQRIDAFKNKLDAINKKSNDIDYKVLGEITEGINYADVGAIVALSSEKAFMSNNVINNQYLISAVQNIKVGESSNAFSIDRKSYDYWLEHLTGHILAYMYRLIDFVFMQTKIGAYIHCMPKHKDKMIFDIDDMIIKLLSIYIAKESNFKRTGASTSLYIEHDKDEATKLISKALLMLGVTAIDENKFKIIEQAMHTQLTKFAKTILKSYGEAHKQIKQHLITNNCITREELKSIVKKYVPKTPKELFLEFKQMIEKLLSIARSGYVYLNTEEQEKHSDDQVLQTD